MVCLPLPAPRERTAPVSKDQFMRFIESTATALVALAAQILFVGTVLI
jgi:hypothetical protein